MTSAPLSIVDEFRNAPVPDERLQRRLLMLAERVATDPSVSFPRMARSDSELEGMYRFLSNPRVTADQILAPHLRATYRRAAQLETFLAVHDTSAFEFGDLSPEAIGYLNTGKAGFFGHFALLLSADGARPLGLGGLETHFRTSPPRKRGKTPARRLSGGEYAKKEKRESGRWWSLVNTVEQRAGDRSRVIHVMDREADSYELLARMTVQNSRFVVRLTQRDRVAQEAGAGADDWGRLDELVRRAGEVAEREVPLSRRKAKATPRWNKANPPRKGRLATLRFAATSATLRRPRYVDDALPATLSVNIVRVFEPNPPPGESPVEWWLVTNEPIETTEQVLAVVDIYRARWKIEEFFKALGTGCSYEKRNLETRPALLNALALLAPIAWQLMALRDIGRQEPESPASNVLSLRQLLVLRAITTRPLSENPTLREALLAVAREGGHLLRNGDPGWQTLGRGLEKLWWAELGFQAGYEQALADGAARATAEGRSIR
jgi:hypothetical protein